MKNMKETLRQIILPLATQLPLPFHCQSKLKEESIMKTTLETNTEIGPFSVPRLIPTL